MINIKIKLFSIVKDIVGKSEINVEFLNGSTASDVLLYIKNMNQKKLGDLPIRVAVNQQYVKGNITLNNDDVVAMIPPVSGG